METSKKLVIATQFYPPDASTTAVYLGKTAEGLAAENNVTVISAPRQHCRDRPGRASLARPIQGGCAGQDPVHSQLGAASHCLPRDRSSQSVPCKTEFEVHRWAVG